MSATIQDVASSCQVPAATVKKVLYNNLADIPEKTIKKIIHTAKKLGYQSVAHTYNLGMIYRDENAKGLTHPYFAAMLNSFKDEAESCGYDVTFINHDIGGENMT